MTRTAASMFASGSDVTILPKSAAAMPPGMVHPSRIAFMLLLACAAHALAAFFAAAGLLPCASASLRASVRQEDGLGRAEQQRLPVADVVPRLAVDGRLEDLRDRLDRFRVVPGVLEGLDHALGDDLARSQAEFGGS